MFKFNTILTIYQLLFNGNYSNQLYEITIKSQGVHRLVLLTAYGGAVECGGTNIGGAD